MKFPEPLELAIQQLSSIPGIGNKTALRYALTIAEWCPEDICALGNSINALGELRRCQRCGIYTKEKLCSICLNEYRVQRKTLCIVENASDCIAIEKSNTYDGTFHILGGVLNPLLGIGPDELNLDHLFRRIVVENIENLILAVNPSVEGDATCSYIKQQMQKNINVERIGFGIPMGGHLEYLDSMTISKALENRKQM